MAELVSVHGLTAVGLVISFVLGCLIARHVVACFNDSKTDLLEMIDDLQSNVSELREDRERINRLLSKYICKVDALAKSVDEIGKDFEVENE